MLIYRLFASVQFLLICLGIGVNLTEISLSLQQLIDCSLMICEYYMQKFKGGTDLGTGGEEDTLYDGRITDAAIDGSIDYKGRPADKATTGRWHGVSYIMGNLYAIMFSRSFQKNYHFL